MMTLTGHLQAEALLLRGSAGLRLSLIGGIFGLLSVLSWMGAQSAGIDSQATTWQVVYFTGLAAPLMIVVGAFQEQRDRRARMAGLLWRGASPQAAQLTRLVGASVIAFFFQVLSYGAIVLLAGAPIGQSAQGLFLSWVGALSFLALGAVLGRRLGVGGAFLLGLFLQAAGTLLAEKPWWWLVPPTWPVRLLLVPTGTNANGTPIDAANPALADPAGMVLGMCLVLAAALWAWAACTASAQDPRPLFARRESSGATALFAMDQLGGKVTPAAPRALPMGAVLLMLGGTGVFPAVALAAAVIVATTLTYDPQVAGQILAFVLFPLVAGMVPALMWRAYRPGYVPLFVKNSATTRAFVAVQLLLIGALAVVVGGCLFAAGMGPVDAATQVLLWAGVGGALSLVFLAVTVRYGTAAALSGLVVWTIMSITIGGDVLTDTFMWVSAVPVWPYLAATDGRLGTALLLCLALGAGGLWAGALALSRVRLRS